MVIDAFCGTGALGLEALSRGARGALLVDAHRTALDLARTNAQALGLAPICQFWQRDATRLDPRPAGQDPASLVFLDPPYHQNLVIPTLESLSNDDWLVQSGTTLVVETERDLTLTLPPGFQVVAQKSHGAATLTLLDWTVL
jgi:16S rRNA (guanine966-N2)-methyltransferase